MTVKPYMFDEQKDNLRPEYTNMSDIKKRSGSLSVISNYRLSTNHEFHWDQVHILDKEFSYIKKSILEMIYINRQDLNKQSDMELLRCVSSNPRFLISLL